MMLKYVSFQYVTSPYHLSSLSTHYLKHITAMPLLPETAGSSYILTFLPTLVFGKLNSSMIYLEDH